MIAPNSHAREGGGRRYGVIWGEEKGNADYGEIM